MKKVASFALGCKVNQVESEAIAEAFASRGYEVVDVDEAADVYVINTCTVTNVGDKKSRQMIRKVRRQNPQAIVVAVGCYAQTAPEEMKAMAEVDILLGTKGRGEIVDAVEQYQRGQGVLDLVTGIRQEHTFEPISVSGMHERTRAYLKIQDGCSQFCSYCIIPYARGPVRSRPEDEVVAEVRRLAENGFQEVVLTGIHVASYGKDLKNTSLLQVLEKIHPIEGIHRIRFSSIEPNVVTEAFLEGLSRLPKVCHHFHLSLQSGAARTLKEMNRKYTPAKYAETVAMLRSLWPDVAVTTDMIVGFPGETKEDFAQSEAFARQMGFAKIHVFPYSPKRGTPAAARPDQVAPEEKNRRAKILGKTAHQLQQAFLARFLGQEMEVLVERQGSDGLWQGHTSNYIAVEFAAEGNLKNALVMAKLTRLEGEKVWAEVTQGPKEENTF